MEHPPPDVDPPLDPPLDPVEDDEQTAEILIHAKLGDPAAREKLVHRHLRALMRMAHGRLPARTRGEFETGDVVHETFLKVFKNLGNIEPRERGYFLAYLRKVLNNLIRDAYRRAARRPDMEPGYENLPDGGPSPLEILAIKENLETYENALALLSQDKRDVVRMRFEGGMSYREIAEAVGDTSANTVRMQVVRSLAELARRMAKLRGE